MDLNKFQLNLISKEKFPENIRVSTSVRRVNICDATLKYFAVIIEVTGGGAFIIVPLKKMKFMMDNLRVIRGHESPITEIVFDPHNDHRIASGSEDGTVKIWDIEDGDKILSNLCSQHVGRVDCIVWHPKVVNVLVTLTCNKKITIWDVATESPVKTIDLLEGLPFSLDWDQDGLNFLVTSQDKKLRVIDSQSGSIIEEAEVYSGSKPSRALFLRDGHILMTGFSGTMNRQVTLRVLGSLSESTFTKDLDEDTGVLVSRKDRTNNEVYLFGKGDKHFSVFFLADNEPRLHHLVFKIDAEIRGLAIAVNLNPSNMRICELTRVFLVSSRYCHLVSIRGPSEMQSLRKQCERTVESRLTTPLMPTESRSQSMEPQVDEELTNVFRPIIKEVVRECLTEELEITEVAGSSRCISPLILGPRLRLPEKYRTAAMAAINSTRASFAVMDAVFEGCNLAELDYKTILRSMGDKLDMIQEMYRKVQLLRSEKNPAEVHLGLDELTNSVLKKWLKTRKQAVKRRGTN